MKPSRRIRAALGIAAAALTLAAATGCFNPFSPRTRSERAVSSPPPVPSSPDQVIELFAWCWRNRAYQEYTEIFTDDFRFQFSVRDTAGQGGRGEFLDRTAELETARHLFIEGNANEPPARSITLEFTGTLRPEPDSRDGQNGLIKKTPWHYQIATDVLLRIDTGEQEFNVVGRATFYLVRGDSAQIPADLGLARDSTRWWIERWEDETDGGAAAASIPRIESLRAVPVGLTAGSGSPVSRSATPTRAALEELRLTWTQLKLGYLGRNR